MEYFTWSKMKDRLGTDKLDVKKKMPNTAPQKTFKTNMRSGREMLIIHQNRTPPNIFIGNNKPFPITLNVIGHNSSLNKYRLTT